MQHIPLLPTPCLMLGHRRTTRCIVRLVAFFDAFVPPCPQSPFLWIIAHECERSACGLSLGTVVEAGLAAGLAAWYQSHAIFL